MIKSVKHIHSSGDAIEFVEDNIEFLQRIEAAIDKICGHHGANPYEIAAMLFESDLE